MKYLKAIALVLVFGTALMAQGGAVDNGTLAYYYDLDSTDLIYCRANGQANTPFSAPIAGPGRVTAATDPTLTCDGSTSCFANVAANDILYLNGTPYQVLTRTDANNVELHTSATVTSIGWSYKELVCGTGATDGFR